MSSFEVPNIDDARKKTEKSQQEKQKNLDLAKKELIELIKKNFTENYIYASKKALSSARLFSWVKNINDQKSYTFNGFTVYDIINDGNIIEDLKKMFNEKKKPGQDDYHVGYYFFKHDEKKKYNNEGTSYIYLSWAKKENKQ